jgi:hypothetical protein
MIQQIAAASANETQEERDYRMRNKVVDELLVTETEYIRDMGVLIGVCATHGKPHCDVQS